MNHPNDPPTLEYARPQEDSPEWVLAAEEAIEAGASPSQLRALFGRPQQAANYYALSQARRFSIYRLGLTCVVCGSPESNRACVAVWQAYAIHSFQLGNPVSATFTAFHRMCANCHGRIVRHAGTQTRFEVAATVICISLLIASIVFDQMRYRFAKDAPVFIAMASCVLGVTLAMTRRFVYPRSLRALMPTGVTLRTIDTKLLNTDERSNRNPQ